MTSVKFKDLGIWGKSIGSINLYDGTSIEITPELWVTKKFKKTMFGIIDKRITQLTIQEKCK